MHEHTHLKARGLLELKRQQHPEAAIGLLQEAVRLAPNLQPVLNWKADEFFNFCPFVHSHPICALPIVHSLHICALTVIVQQA
eukprot:scaffold124712_cov15-Tisochrysis_lutea.AAC.1